MTWKDRLSEWLWRANDSRALHTMERASETLSQAYDPNQPNVAGANAAAKQLAERDVPEGS
jgi:hypothetical protein